MVSRIIEYTVVDEQPDQQKLENAKSPELVVKKPVFTPTDVTIQHNELKVCITEPKLQLTRNSEGVIIGIEVLCTCGEKILIRLDYKL